METIKTSASSSKTSSTITLKDDLKGLTTSQKEELAAQIGELLVEQILESVAVSKSPVTGDSFARLSKDYADKKKSETGSSAPNLDLTGSMLTSLDYKISGDKLELGVFGEDAGKADGHNNFSGKSKLPTRQFLPKSGESFDKSIVSLVSDTIDQYKADNMSFKSKELKQVETKSDLYELLKDKLGDKSRSELKKLVLSSELSAELDAFDLLDLL